MSNYEVMLILDPKSDEKIVSEIAKTTFKSKDIKIEKLERTELAYEINKSKTAIYVLITVKATGEEINEFTRKSNITKNIWRILSLNLDTEKGLNRKAKSKKVKRFSNIKKSQPLGDKKVNVEDNEEVKENKKEEKKTTKKTKKEEE